MGDTYGVQTRYAGTIFRSRLEARWAALFDLLQWQWTYEPFEADHYVPDFLIGGWSPMVVEIKPAAAEPDYQDALLKVAPRLENCWDNDILIVGASPIASCFESCCDLHPPAGLLGRGLVFRTGCWFRCPQCTSLAIAYEDKHFEGRPCGHDGIGPGGAARAVQSAWADATNAVRWEPKR